MSTDQKTEVEQPQKLLMRPAVEQMTEAERIELVDSIEQLQMALRRFIPLLNSESVEIATRSQLAVEKIAAEFQQAFSFHFSREARNPIENWENEGGACKHVAT